MQGVLLATALGLAVALLGTPWAIGLLRARGLGELIREDGPTTHFVKHGTPTMGGLVLLAAATVGYLGAHVRFHGVGLRFRPVTVAGLLVLGCAWALGLVGAADDVAKIRRRRSLGLSKRTKLACQVLVGFVLAYGAMRWVRIPPRISWSGAYDVPFLPQLPEVVFALFVVLMIAGTSNAVNLTDGLDGLACGSSAMTFFVYTIIAFWELRNREVYGSLAPPSEVPAHLDVAYVAAALLGACIGFLWWNAAPARIFMGDTGSLALGGALAALALVTRTQLLLAVIGGLFVVETLSVIVQVVSYRLFGHRRVFAMAPLHHHFELRGWAEFTVIVRFWLVAALSAGLGLALFYMDFLTRAGIGK